MSGPTVRLQATIVGRVQGVGYRYFVREVALGLGLGGWVANAPDGSVTCVAEGSRAHLERLRRELERGPLGARVDAVHCAWLPASGTSERFEIRAGTHAGD